MHLQLDLVNMILGAWKTNNRVTIFFVKHLPPELWEAKVPEAPGHAPRRTIRSVASHLHNARCSWIKTLGKPHGIEVPRSVDRHNVTPKELLSALELSGIGILGLLQLGCDHQGTIPATSAYVWRNLPVDVGHVLGYFTAHEAHHRGQIVMLARQLGHRLPKEATEGIWQWSKRAKEV